MILGGDTGETGGELAGIVWEEMGCMGVQVFRRSRNGLRPVGVLQALPCMGKRISKTPKRPRSDVP